MGDCSSIVPNSTMPALFTRIPTAPNSRDARSMTACHCASSATSREAKRAGSPSSAASAFPSLSRRSAITTVAPSATNRRAIEAPMPRAPPVTTATLPSSFPTTLTPSARGYRFHSNAAGAGGEVPDGTT